jgi:hypothetical protein
MTIARRWSRMPGRLLLRLQLLFLRHFEGARQPIDMAAGSGV